MSKLRLFRNLEPLIFPAENLQNEVERVVVHEAVRPERLPESGMQSRERVGALHLSDDRTYRVKNLHQPSGFG